VAVTVAVAAGLIPLPRVSPALATATVRTRDGDQAAGLLESQASGQPAGPLESQASGQVVGVIVTAGQNPARAGAGAGPPESPVRVVDTQAVRVRVIPVGRVPRALAAAIKVIKAVRARVGQRAPSAEDTTGLKSLCETTFLVTFQVVFLPRYLPRFLVLS